MQTPIDLKAVTDRVLGLSPPRVPMAARLPRPWDRQLGLALMVISALVSASCLWLWLDGQTTIAARLLGVAVIGLAMVVRLL